MSMNNRLNLETLALGYTQGSVCIDGLIKACEAYKRTIGHEDTYVYNTYMLKSIADQLNGIEPDPQICKAIIPGQVKMFNGTMFIWSPTKQGSQTQYAWHVVKHAPKTGSTTGNYNKLSAEEIKASEEAANIFPKDLSKLKIIGDAGGSTGARRVKDDDGNEYILKTGVNTSADHVRGEYLANQLYSVLGVKVPNYELYDNGNNDVKLLSIYLPSRSASSADAPQLAKNFIVDCVLANWDVYQNDNCRVDNVTGDVYRVDNGSCFDWRAQGSKKIYDDDIVKTYKDMRRYNPGIDKILTDDTVLEQIDDITKRKHTVVSFLIESGQDKLAHIVEQRIDNLQLIATDIKTRQQKHNLEEQKKLQAIKPRTLKSATEMYTELSDKALDDALDTVAKKSGCPKNEFLLHHYTPAFGWSVLSEICKLRGFNARPRVVSSDEFWKTATDPQRVYPVMFRGNSKGGGKTGADYADAFRTDDNCYYGTMGIYGQGIYTHCDDTWDKNTGKSVNNNCDNTNYKLSDAYQHAIDYTTDRKDQSVLKLCWEKDAKIIDSHDLLDELKHDIPTVSDSKLNDQIHELKQQVDDYQKALADANRSYLKIADIAKKQAFSDMHYDENAAKTLLDTLNNTDWGKRKITGEVDYPQWDDIVVGRLIPTVKACGGRVKTVNQGREDEGVIITANNNSMWLTKHSWNNNAIRQKNPYLAPYHIHANKFTMFFNTNIVKPAYDAVDKTVNKMSTSLKKDIDNYKKMYDTKKNEYEDAIRNASSNGIRSMIYNSCKDLKYDSTHSSSSELLGLYAAIKGYDGIYQRNGNGYDHGFCVILNRSKVITSIV